jgi:hypothetical protein
MTLTNNQIPTLAVKTKEQLWNEHILLKRKIGATRVSYCKKHKLNLIQFRYWEQKYNAKSNKPSSNLVPIKLDTVKAIPGFLSREILCTLSLKNGNELKVYNPKKRS